MVIDRSGRVEKAQAKPSPTRGSRAPAPFTQQRHNVRLISTPTALLADHVVSMTLSRTVAKVGRHIRLFTSALLVVKG